MICTRQSRSLMAVGVTAWPSTKQTCCTSLGKRNARTTHTTHSFDSRPPTECRPARLCCSSEWGESDTTRPTQKKLFRQRRTLLEMAQVTPRRALSLFQNMRDGGKIIFSYHCHLSKVLIRWNDGERSFRFIDDEKLSDFHFSSFSDRPWLVCQNKMAFKRSMSDSQSGSLSRRLCNQVKLVVR